MNILKLASATIALLISSSVNASLIDNGNYTTDTVSGLNWLDLTETNGLTYYYVSSQLAAGGVYDGWRYATLAETENLFMEFGLPITNTSESPISASTLSGITTMISYLGNTPGEFSAEYSGSLGLVDVSSGSGSHLRVGALTTGYGASAVTESTVFETDSYGANYFGHYLVQLMPVPVPAAVWLFSTGLVGLITIARRKSRS
jgi:hypothetical protein